MTRKVIALGVLLLPLVATGAFTQSKKATNPLQGVWKVTEVTTTGPNASTNKNPQPGLYIFMNQYYSVLEVSGDKPRPDYPRDWDKATASQVWDVVGPFSANAGTYEVKGSEVTRRPMVAKNPAVMAGDWFFTNSFVIEGNTLTLVGKANKNGPTQNPTTVKLTRVE